MVVHVGLIVTIFHDLVQDLRDVCNFLLHIGLEQTGITLTGRGFLLHCSQMLLLVFISLVLRCFC